MSNSDRNVIFERDQETEADIVKAGKVRYLMQQHTWSVADGSIKRSPNDTDIKRFVRSCQAPDMLEVGEGRDSTETPLLRVNYLVTTQCGTADLRRSTIYARALAVEYRPDGWGLALDYRRRMRRPQVTAEAQRRLTKKRNEAF